MSFVLASFMLLAVPWAGAGTSPSPSPSRSPAPARPIAGELTAAKAMHAVYGNYDAKRKSSSVDGLDEKWGNAPAETFAAHNEVFEIYKEDGKERAVLVAILQSMQLDDDGHLVEAETCGMCAPYVSVYGFARDKTGWKLDRSLGWWKQSGANGVGPGLEWVALGPEKHGLQLSMTTLNSGSGSSFVEIYRFTETGGMRPVFSATLSEDSSGSCDKFPCDDHYEVDLKILHTASAAGLYDLQLEKKGLEKSESGALRPVHENARYAFDGKQYVLKQKTPLPVPAEIKQLPKKDAQSAPYEKTLEKWMRAPAN